MEEYIKILLIKAPPILFALTVHEWAHGLAAVRLGDLTPRMLGRVSLNPLVHLDLVGTAALFLTGMFGWAKPVPINPHNFKNPSRAMMFVALAGPLANLALAAVFSLAYKGIVAGGYMRAIDSSTVLWPVFFMLRISIIVNISLAVFNLIPIPPLDGSRVLAHFLPADKAAGYSKIEPYGFMILIALLYTGVIGRVVSPLVFYTVRLMVWGGM
ncbi:MAG: site-2 protease family protein [Deltaproteobacteria bacterium]|nr:site-2 protease family protein [Deltaproteobacteria bacterium]